MRAVVVRQLGDASSLTLDEARAVPSLRPGEVLVRNSFAGLNFHDTYTRSGLYPMPRPTDFVVGCEGGGVVAHVPAGMVCGVKEGDRVVYLQVHLEPHPLIVSLARAQPNIWSLCLRAGRCARYLCRVHARDCGQAHARAGRAVAASGHSGR